MSSKEIVVILISIMCVGIFIYVTTSYNPCTRKPTHTVSYELYSKNGLSGRFEWADINFIGRYTDSREFIRDVNNTQYSCKITSHLEAPFRISVEGMFDHPTLLRICVDNKIIEELHGELFASEWLLSRVIGQTEGQFYHWKSGRKKPHIGYK